MNYLPNRLLEIFGTDLFSVASAEASKFKEECFMHAISKHQKVG